MPNADLIYNPFAGRYPSGWLAERAANVLRREGWQIRLMQSHNGPHLARLAHQTAQAGKDALFIVGGDGSMNLALPGLMGSETALGMLPAGTANVWAQELGLPGLTWTRWMALEESAHRLAHACVRKVDIGLCRTTPFLLWAGVGLDAFVVHRIEPRARWEKHFATLHYAASTLWSASLWHGISLRIEADGKQISGRFLLATVSNIHLYAGGLAHLSPAARLDDQVMDLWLFNGETLGDAVQRAWDLIAGRHVQSDQVACVPFRSLVLESDSPLYAQVDGEPVPGEGRVTIEVIPQKLNVLMPEMTPHPLFSDQPAG